MVIYVEFIFLVNFIADLTLSVVTLRALRESVKPFRVLFAAAVGAVASVFYILIPIGIWFKFLLSFVIVAILAHWKSLKAFLKGLIVFYCISALYAGVAQFFMSLGFGEILLTSGSIDVSPILTAAAFVVATLLAEGAFSAFYARQKVVKRFYRIEVASCGGSVITQGFYDTGNTLCENGEPVVVVSKKLATELHAETIGAMPVMTVTGIRFLNKIPLTIRIYYSKNKNKLFQAQGVVSDEPLKAPVILNSNFEEEL